MFQHLFPKETSLIKVSMLIKTSLCKIQRFAVKLQEYSSKYPNRQKNTKHSMIKKKNVLLTSPTPTNFLSIQTNIPDTN